MGVVMDGRAGLGPEHSPRPAELLDTVPLWTPVHPHPYPELLERAREELANLGGDRLERSRIPRSAALLQELVRSNLARYIEEERPNADRLYVLEFQGQHQYVMFGHTQHLLRRVKTHMTSASPHGYALIQGWASTAIEDARSVEHSALDCAACFGHWHDHERFHDMPFEKGLKIVRMVIELSSS